jgi:hypothetical protein
MPPDTNEMIYAALKEAVEHGLLPKGASQDRAVENFETMKAVLQTALGSAK